MYIVLLNQIEMRADLPAQVSAQVLGSWRSESHIGKILINLGDLTQGATREVYVKLIFPPAEDAKPLLLAVQVMARGEEDEVLSAHTEISFTRDSAAAVHSAERNQELLNRFALVYIADVASRALKLEREGKREAARRLLEPALLEFGQFLDDSKRMYYENLGGTITFGLDENQRKMSHYSSYIDKQGRIDPNRKS